MTAMPVLMPPPVAAAAVLLLAVFAAPLSAQSQIVPETRPVPSGLLLSTDVIETEFYTPEHTPAHNLLRYAQPIIGRPFYVEEKGGYGAPPIQNMQQVGDSILIYDEPTYIAKVLKTLKLFDRDPEQGKERAALTAQHWSPGFIALDSGYEALEPFQRLVANVDAHGNTQSTRNVSMLNSQRVLVLRDTPDQVAQMLDLLRSIDRPEPQLMITATVIRGEHGGSSDDVPAELAQELAKLVPFDSFSMGPMGLVRSSARARSIELRLDDSTRLDLRPDAFDEDTLTLSGLCQFSCDEDFRFETRTSVSAGEYTVLGVNGQLAMFVVLRIEPID